MKNQLDINSIQSPILLFDGYCNLCNGAVDFILKNENSLKIYFASLQSDIGQNMLINYGKNESKMDTLYFVNEGKIYHKALACLQITKFLQKPWCYLSILGILPIGFLNLFYNFIAKYRYTFFGKKETCRLPTKEEKERFL